MGTNFKPPAHLSTASGENALRDQSPESGAVVALTGAGETGDIDQL
jgi:hypothetical protein